MTTAVEHHPEDPGASDFPLLAECPAASHRDSTLGALAREHKPTLRQAGQGSSDRNASRSSRSSDKLTTPRRGSLAAESSLAGSSAGHGPLCKQVELRDPSDEPVEHVGRVTSERRSGSVITPPLSSRILTSTY